MTRSSWWLALAVSIGADASASADTLRFQIDVPAGELTVALAALSTQTGASIGIGDYSGGVRAERTKGKLSVDEALARMLAKTPYRAERAGPSVWRLVARPILPTRVAAPPVTPDIIVTARKMPEPLSSAASPIAVYVPRFAGSAASEGIHDVSASVEGLTVTNLGPGRDRSFIRGIADSPFNGFSQATVSVNVDDARVTYDAPEPGLRLVDVARVEVLKGPQGPLYGTGALGGVYRIVTNRPVLGTMSGEVGFGMSQVSEGGIGGEASAVLNLPIVDDRIAVRGVAYTSSQAGWIRNDARGRPLNDQHVTGGRLALRFAPARDWTVDITATGQNIDLRDSQYVDRGAEDLTRTTRLPEPSSSRFALVSGSVSGALGDLRLTIATSHAWQDRYEKYDVAPAASALGEPGATSYVDRRAHRVFDQEIRIASASGSDVMWMAGVSYLSATTLATGTLSDGAGTVLPFSFLLHRGVTEAAVFADGSVELVPRVRVGLGARVFRATTDDERVEDLATANVAKARFGVTPSGSLTYSFAPDRTVYLRFGTAFRPGGLDPTNMATGRYDSDEVRSVELGARATFDQGRLSLTAGGFHTEWSHVQTDYLLPDGLIATRNAGDAVIVGTELSSTWRRWGWTLQVGAAAQRARLEATADGANLPADRRMPAVPDVTGRINVGRRVHVAGIAADITLRGTYTGSSRLSFDDGLDRRMGDYALLHADAATTLGRLELRISALNLLDTRADSFAFGNPFRIRLEKQYTPLQPRTVSVSLARHF